MAFWPKTLSKWLLDIDNRDISSHKTYHTWFYLALLWVLLVYLRKLFTYLFPPFSCTGHPTPRPTLWALCLCHIQYQYNIMLGCGGKPLIERLREKNTSTKTPVLASPTQAETAVGVYPTNLCISAGSSRMKSIKWSIFYINFMEFCLLYSKTCLMFIFIFNCVFNIKIASYLKLQVEVEDWLENKFWNLRTAFQETKNDKSPRDRLKWTRLCQVMMVCSSAIAKFESTLYRVDRSLTMADWFRL
jgi:hypothetical protein